MTKQRHVHGMMLSGMAFVAYAGMPFEVNLFFGLALCCTLLAVPWRLHVYGKALEEV